MVLLYYECQSQVQRVANTLKSCFMLCLKKADNLCFSRKRRSGSGGAPNQMDDTENRVTFNCLLNIVKLLLNVAYAIDHCSAVGIIYNTLHGFIYQCL